MSHCISTFLGKPVEVVRVPKTMATKTDHAGNSLHQWRVGLNSIVGGRGEAANDEIIIRISCDDEDLNNLLPSRPQRQLLEQVVLPAFVNQNMRWEIELKMKEEKPFVIEDTATVRVGFFKISA